MTERNKEMQLKKWEDGNRAFLDKKGIVLSNLPFFECLKDYLGHTQQCKSLPLLLESYQKGEVTTKQVETLLDFPRFNNLGFLNGFSKTEKLFLIKTLLSCHIDENLHLYRFNMLSTAAMGWVLKAAQLQEKYEIQTNLGKLVMMRVLAMTQKDFFRDGLNFKNIPPSPIYQDERYSVYLDVEQTHFNRIVGYETPIKIYQSAPMTMRESANGYIVNEDDKRAYQDNLRWVFKTHLPQIIGELNCRLLCQHSDTGTVRKIVNALLYHDGTDNFLSPRHITRLCLLLGMNADFSFHNFDYSYWMGNVEEDEIGEYWANLLNKLKIILSDPVFGHVWHCMSYNMMTTEQLENCCIKYHSPEDIADNYKKQVLAEKGDHKENRMILESMENWFTPDKETELINQFLKNS